MSQQKPWRQKAVERHSVFKKKKKKPSSKLSTSEENPLKEEEIKTFPE